MIDILGGLAFLFIAISVHQDCIIKLRLWGAAAGLCFLIQFYIIGNMEVNIVGQTGLLLYGIYKAIREIKQKKNIAKDK